MKKLVPGSKTYVEQIVGSQAKFIDNVIYSRYRNFRVIASSKFKNIGRRPLKLYKSDSKTIVKFDNVDKATFFKSK